MTLLIIMFVFLLISIVASNIMVYVILDQNARMRRELTDLQACYRDAIDGKLAVMRELEDLKKNYVLFDLISKEIVPWQE
jgi:hypothetical protein